MYEDTKIKEIGKLNYFVFYIIFKNFSNKYKHFTHTDKDITEYS